MELHGICLAWWYVVRFRGQRGNMSLEDGDTVFYFLMICFGQHPATGIHLALMYIHRCLDVATRGCAQGRYPELGLTTWHRVYSIIR